jgi:hypothetical protein
MATDILGLFTSPEQYQANQMAQFRQRSANEVQLDPFQQAAMGMRQAGYQLGGGIGGALGGQDPQLQKITQRQQLLSMIDPSNPDSYAQAIQVALQSGDQEAAYLLRNEMMKTKQQAMESQKTQLEYQDYLTQRGTGMQLAGLQANLFNADGTRNTEVEKALMSTVAGRKILKDLAPETKELKKGEKLMERQPDGTWKLVIPMGMPTAPTTGTNAVNDLIAGKAIHPTILPYANQIAKSFASLDPEDQDKAIEKLTTLNNTAMSRDDQKTSREMFQASTLATQDLSRQLMKLQIGKAQDAALKAADGKEIKLPDATKLSGQASSVDKLTDLTTAFKPEFAGYPTNALGEADIWRASKSNDPKDVDLYQWWQGYQDHVNKVRNDLFGAALTAPEKAEFEKAMVTKGMNPTQAKANLDRQAQIALKAYNKLDSVLRVQGYSKAALDVLKPTGILPPLENFIIQAPNNNPSNITGGRR